MRDRRFVQKPQHDCVGPSPIRHRSAQRVRLISCAQTEQSRPDSLHFFVTEPYRTNSLRAEATERLGDHRPHVISSVDTDSVTGTLFYLHLFNRPPRSQLNVTAAVGNDSPSERRTMP